MLFEDALDPEHGESDVLESFTDEETLALVDLAFLTIMVDGEVTDVELHSMSNELLEVAFDAEQKAEDILRAHGADDIREEIDRKLEQDESFEDFIQERVERIETREHREAALEVISTLSYSDGLDETEEDIYHDIGRAFGFDEATLEDCFVEGAVDTWELGDGNLD